jgi:hypothetical protein
MPFSLGCPSPDGGLSVRRSGRKSLIFWLFLGLALQGRAADFEIGSQDDAAPLAGDLLPSRRGTLPSSGSATVGFPGVRIPPQLELGDLPSAFMASKYALQTDLKFHAGGGILAKATLGIFRRFHIGGAVELRNFIGSGDMRFGRDDAQLLARLQVLEESNAWPALALGWDGPSYEFGELRGLYLAVSKRFATRLAIFALHGEVNSSRVESFVGSRDLRAGAGASAALGNTLLFTELDEGLNPSGPRWNAGLRATWEPITLGLEFRDLASLRGFPASRLLRVSWLGRF